MTTIVLAHLEGNGAVCQATFGQYSGLLLTVPCVSVRWPGLVPTLCFCLFASVCNLEDSVDTGTPRSLTMEAGYVVVARAQPEPSMRLQCFSLHAF